MNQDKNEKISEFRVGDTFHSTCSISEKELEEYLKFSRVINAFLENKKKGERQLVSGRAALPRTEGEFTRLSQIYGNEIVFLGTDGDSEWENGSTRFLKPSYTDQVLKLKFTKIEIQGIGEQFGKIKIDHEGIGQDDETAIFAKKNTYGIKKDPSR